MSEAFGSKNGNTETQGPITGESRERDLVEDSYANFGGIGGKELRIK